MEWVSDSAQKAPSFIVANSQNESQFSQTYNSPAERLGKLKALSSDHKYKSGRRENVRHRYIVELLFLGAPMRVNSYLDTSQLSFL